MIHWGYRTKSTRLSAFLVKGYDMREIDVIAGGPGGPYGGLYLWSEEIRMGVAYSDVEERDKAMTRLLTNARCLTGEPCVLGKLTERVEQGQSVMIDNDRRQEPPLFGKPLPRKGKRRK